MGNFLETITIPDNGALVDFACENFTDGSTVKSLVESSHSLYNISSDELQMILGATDTQFKVSNWKLLASMMSHTRSTYAGVFYPSADYNHLDAFGRENVIHKVCRQLSRINDDLKIRSVLTATYQSESPVFENIQPGWLNIICPLTMRKGFGGDVEQMHSNHETVRVMGITYRAVTNIEAKRVYKPIVIEGVTVAYLTRNRLLMRINLILPMAPINSLWPRRMIVEP